MDNQHKLISGYRDLSQDDIELMNKIKAHGAATDALLFQVLDSGAEPRWVAIARTELQQGQMALVRSVAKPTGF